MLGISDAAQGIIRHPYLGAKQEGPLGFGKGIGRAFAGFYFHLMAGMSPWQSRKAASLTQVAIFGLPGYFLKGIERGLLRRHLTAVQAEIILIQLRRSSSDFRRGSEEEKAEVLEKWKRLKANIAEHE